MINKIITGDCLEIIPTIDPGSIGLILTSPPYNVGLAYDGFNDDLTDEEHREFNHQWLILAYEAAAETARMYVIVGDKMIYWFKDLAEQAGWDYVQRLVWIKPNLAGRAFGICGDWNYMTEDIMLFRKGKRTPMLRGNKRINTFNWIRAVVDQSDYTEGRHHPAQLPLHLCTTIISRSPGQIVLDPFAGSGQVLRAAKGLGRDYIGIELVEAVANIARANISGTINKHPDQLILIDRDNNAADNETTPGN